MGGGRIDVYMDIVSLYSYLAFLDLQQNGELLRAHNVEVEFHPVLLGAIVVGSGNKPPWTLPAKAVYFAHDVRQSIARFPGLVIQTPKDLMAVSKSIVPNRALHFIKSHHSPSTFLTILHYFMYLFWSPPNLDLTLPENVAKALLECPEDFDGSIAAQSSEGDQKKEKLFTKEQVEEIMKGTETPQIKDALKNTTQEALNKGAFGNPWIWVTDEKGRQEPFFGSDRFHFVYKFLSLPYQDVTLLPPVAAATTVTIPPVTNQFTPTPTTTSTTSAFSTIFTTTNRIPSTTTLSSTSNTPPKINATSQSSHSTAASRHEIILLALGIFILVSQLALIIWVGVRRRRFSLSSSSGSACAYHHWHRENCPRELNGLQLDGRGSGLGCGSGSGSGSGSGRGGGGGFGHWHEKGGKCLWKEAFGESPSSPMSSKTMGLRAKEGMEEEEDGLESSSGSEFAYDGDEGEGGREGIRSRGNSVVIAGAHELVDRVRKRSNSLGTFLMGIGVGEGQHVEMVPEEQQKTATRKRSNTFTMGLGRRISGGGEIGLRERKGSAATATATTIAREGNTEMGVGRTSGLSADLGRLGGKFDGTEERDGGGGGSKKRRGSWVQVLRRFSGLGYQHGVQDPEKGGCW
ncbi:thioredoxin-like protein [Neurospora tetrasperma FGSC 2509]|nr:thioredoxin-like protein [Neurospora tetrasperma FGSC 2509]